MVDRNPTAYLSLVWEVGEARQRQLPQGVLVALSPSWMELYQLMRRLQMRQMNLQEIGCSEWVRLHCDRDVLLEVSGQVCKLVCARSRSRAMPHHHFGVRDMSAIGRSIRQRDQSRP